MAPMAMGAEMPRAVPMASSTTPTEPMVPMAEPNSRETITQTRKPVTRKLLGLKMPRP